MTLRRPFPQVRATSNAPAGASGDPERPPAQIEIDRLCARLVARARVLRPRVGAHCARSAGSPRTRPDSNGQPPSPTAGWTHRYRVGASRAGSRPTRTPSQRPTHRVAYQPQGRRAAEFRRASLACRGEIEGFRPSMECVGPLARGRPSSSAPDRHLCAEGDIGRRQSLKAWPPQPHGAAPRSRPQPKACRPPSRGRGCSDLAR